MVLWRVLIVRGEQRAVFRVQFITEIIQVLLAVVLIPPMGCYGAAWALLGGNLAYAVYIAYYVRRDDTPLPLVQLSWRFVLASIVMGLLAWLCAAMAPFVCGDSRIGRSVSGHALVVARLFIG